MTRTRTSTSSLNTAFGRTARRESMLVRALSIDHSGSESYVSADEVGGFT